MALSYAGNSIEEAGATELNEALQVNKTLRELHLSYNRIKGAGAIALAGAIRVNTTLHTLHLADNDIGDQGALKIAEALQVALATIKLSELAMHIMYVVRISACVCVCVYTCVRLALVLFHFTASTVQTAPVSEPILAFYSVTFALPIYLCTRDTDSWVRRSTALYTL
jgi:hypothetical protein